MNVVWFISLGNSFSASITAHCGRVNFTSCATDAARQRPKVQGKTVLSRHFGTCLLQGKGY